MGRETMKLFHRLGQGLPSTLLVTAGIAVAGLCSGVVLARTLLPVSRGEFAVVLIWPGALAMFGELGLGFSFSFYAGKDRAKLDGLWTLALGVSLIWGGFLSIVGALVFPGIVHLSAAAHSCLIWNLITVPISLLTGYSAYFLLGSNRVFEFNMVRLSGAVVYTVGILALALTHQASVTKYTLVYILSQWLACAVAVGFIVRRLKPVLRWQSSLVKPVFIYGGKTYLSSLAAQMNLRLDQLLMSSLVATEQLGLYVIAVSFSSMLMPLFSALAVVTLPRVTCAPDLRAGGRQVVRYLQLGLVMGLPAMAFAIITAPWLLPLFFSAKYASSILSAQILLVGVIFQGSNIVLGNGLRGLGQPGKTMLSEGAGLIVTVVLLVWLLPVYGALGAAVASLSAYSLVTFIQLFFVRQAAGLEWRDFGLVSWINLFPDWDVLRQWRVKRDAALRRND